jgi:hypothetical protein
MYAQIDPSTDGLRKKGRSRWDAAGPELPTIQP